MNVGGDMVLEMPTFGTCFFCVLPFLVFDTEVLVSPLLLWEGHWDWPVSSRLSVPPTPSALAVHRVCV